MAKITDKDSISVVDVDDVLHVVDVSDVTSSPQGTSKQLTLEQLKDFVIDYSKGYESEGGFISTITQAGTEDVATTISFGAGGLTPNGHVSVAASGEFEIMTTGYYSIKQRFRAGRSGASGVSEIFFWAEISTDGGSTWSVIGNSVDIALNNSNDTTVFFDLSNVLLPVGVKLRNRFARSSTGHDSGDLVPSTPSSTLTSAGVPVAPSAQVSIYKISL